MWKRRNRILKKTATAIATALNAGGSALVSMYDVGAVLVHRSLALVPNSKQAERGLKILKSKMKIVALKSEIARENVFIDYFSLLRHAKKY